EPATLLDGAAHALDAATVSFDARQSAALRPAAVAVHDDGDVVRQAGRVEAGGFQALQGVGVERRGHRQLPKTCAAALAGCGGGVGPAVSTIALSTPRILPTL